MPPTQPQTNGAFRLTVMGKVSSRLLVRAQNGNMAAIPASTVESLGKLGITIDDNPAEYVI